MPTFRAGTADDAIIMAAGKYTPEGVLPDESATTTETELVEFFPVYITESKVIGEHMASFLDLDAVRPDAISGQSKYNARGLTAKEWAKRNAEIEKDWKYTKLQHKLNREGFGADVEGLYGEMTKIYRSALKDLPAKAKDANKLNNTESFAQKNKTREKISEYKNLLAQGEFARRSKIQKEVTRENWRRFLETSKIYDLRGVYQFFARMGGRGIMGSQPSCLDPLQDGDQLVFKPEDKAKLPGAFFKAKMAATEEGNTAPLPEIQARTGWLTQRGVLKLENKISVQEIRLATEDIPKNKAVGPDMFQAEVYVWCPAMHRSIAALYTCTIERNYVPKRLRSFYVIPLDKPGKDPTKCASKRPIALLSPLVKLLGLVLVRRILPHVENRVSCGQYAYQRARSTEILLADLDNFVTGNMKRGRPTYVVGLGVEGAFDSASLVKLVEALLYYEVPAPICRIVGTWLGGGRFKIKLRTPLGVVFSGEHMPTRGVPQGGVLSPLLWLLHVNRIIEETLRDLRKTIKMPPLSWEVIIQIFADDISAAIGHEHRPEAIQLAHLLIAELCKQLDKTELNVSTPKCQNFLVEKKTEKETTNRVEQSSSMKPRRKEEKKHRMNQDLDCLEAKVVISKKKRGGASVPMDLQL